MSKKTKLKLEHKPLHCPVCAERFMNILGQPLPNHAQIRCKTLTGDEMDIGICENCIEQGVTLEMTNAILEGIKDYWCAEIDVDKNLKSAERAERKALHRNHTIRQVNKIVRTGKEAEAKARKRGELE
jgi:hypothetical protein